VMWTTLDVEDGTLVKVQRNQIVKEWT
jgi:hypothetical protein